MATAGMILKMTQNMQLGWKILEWKFLYYHPWLVHPARRVSLEISDQEFDSHVLANGGSKDVGFPWSRPAAQTVAIKLNSSPRIKTWKGAIKRMRKRNWELENYGT